MRTGKHRPTFFVGLGLFLVALPAIVHCNDPGSERSERKRTMRVALQTLPDGAPDPCTDNSEYDEVDNKCLHFAMRYCECRKAHGPPTAFIAVKCKDAEGRVLENHSFNVEEGSDGKLHGIEPQGCTSANPDNAEYAYGTADPGDYSTIARNFCPANACERTWMVSSTGQCPTMDDLTSVMGELVTENECPDAGPEGGAPDGGAGDAAPDDAAAANDAEPPPPDPSPSPTEDPQPDPPVDPDPVDPPRDDSDAGTDDGSSGGSEGGGETGGSECSDNSTECGGTGDRGGDIEDGGTGGAGADDESGG
jgi:hypothetical protein